MKIIFLKTIFLNQFRKDIEKLRLQSVKDAIIGAIDDVEQATDTNSIRNLKKLKGYKTADRIRIGEYQIGLFIEDDTVEFVRVVHRREVYKFFP